MENDTDFVLTASKQKKNHQNTQNKKVAKYINNKKKTPPVLVTQSFLKLDQ